MDELIYLGLIMVSLLIYFIPSMVASTRVHKNTFAIIILNILTGWTFLGWVIALVWACTKDTYLYGFISKSKAKK